MKRVEMMEKYYIGYRAGHTTAFSESDLYDVLRYLKLTNQDIFVYDETEEKPKMVLIYVNNRISFTKKMIDNLPEILKLYEGCELGAPLE